MFNKLFWMIALILLTAGSMFIPGLLGNQSAGTTPDASICEECTLEMTQEPVEVLQTGETGEDAPLTEIPPSNALAITSESHTFSLSSLTATTVGMPFIVQPNTPVYIGNFAHKDSGCSWSGVAGQVFGSDGNPLSNIVVRVKGFYNKKNVVRIGITGMQAGAAYGPAGYELKIGGVAKSTRRRLKIQLFSLDNKPLSAPFKFNTYSDCQKNLAIINFKTADGTTVVNPTSTITPEPLITPTPPATVEATSTSAPSATITPVNTATPFVTATIAATRTATIQPGTFNLQPVTPVYVGNFVYSDAGCAWQGVAGQVFDRDGKPLTNMVIKITGSWNGNSISKVALTGMVSGLPYGPGSYEIVLGNSAVESTDTLRVQVFDSESKAITDAIPFNTYADCAKNLVIINFKQY